MRLATRAILLIGLAAVLASKAAAGVVDVSFIASARFADTGSTPWEREANLAALAGHLQALGQRHLPADQTLKIEVLDVDLAGETRPSRRTGRDLRIVRGQADWPRIQLRYTLMAEGKPLQSGNEKVADMNYAQGFDGMRNSEPLYYEKRMLDHWFKARFVERQPGPVDSR